MSSLTFNPANRITERKDYLHCYDTGRRFFSAHFVVFACRRESSDLPWRIGMAVTKKTGSAVWRNRVRRLIKECCRLHQYQLAKGIDIVVVPKKNLDPRVLSLRNVEEEVIPLLRNLAKKL